MKRCRAQTFIIVIANDSQILRIFVTRNRNEYGKIEKQY